MPSNSSQGNGKQQKSRQSSQDNRRARNDEQHSNERTPLLSRDGQNDGDGHSDNVASDNERSSPGDGDEDDQDTVVSDLGDFAVQPRDLANCLADKDVEGLLKLGSSSSSQSGSSSQTNNKQDGSVQALLDALQTDEKNGLSSDQYSEDGAEERIRVYGRNKLPEREMKSFWRFLWEAFCDKVLIILSIAAAVSFALGMWQDFGPQHDPEEPRVNWVEGVAIMTAIVIVTVTSSVNDYSKEKQFKALSETKEIPNVDVLRDGKKYKIIKAPELLIGDIVSIKAGDILRSDGVLLSSLSDVKVDESDATGESDAISKTPLQSIDGSKNSGEDGNDNSKDDDNKNKKKEESATDPFLLSGSKVLEGKGHYVVIAVGPRSFQGKIFMSLRSSQPDQTRMQKQLADLAEKIAKLASIAGGILFLALFIRNCVELKTNPDRTPAEKGQSFLQSFVISVTLIVVAVPEGLPLAVTLALAFATNRMTQHNLLVRVFEACETMSNANVIVTDKTGTLTANEMRVVEGTIGGVRFSLREKQNHRQGDQSNNAGQADGDKVKDLEGLKESLKKNDKLFTIWADSIAINTTAFQQDDQANGGDGQQDSTSKRDKKQGKPNKKQKKQSHNGSNGDAADDHEDDPQAEGPKFVGNKTESALLRMLDWDFRDLKDQSYAEIREEAETVMLFPFSSERKAMATAIKLKEGGKYRLLVKGAAEAILDLCVDRAKLESGDIEEREKLDEKGKKEVEDLIEEYASRSLRTIAMAYRDYDEWPPSSAGTSGEGGDKGKVKYDAVAKDLTLLAIPGIEDPLRSGVPEAVDKCHKAGVDVKMCTGDNILTAKAIAKQCDIHDADNKDAIVISGADWRKLSDEEKREQAPKISVMARSLPQDKQTLVKALQDVGMIVGVTGDGTNDALALKDGDVGFSMGQTGTEVAKEASDVVIMDDNFATIVSAIAWGRCVSDAVRKFLQFQLAVNITAIIITFASAVVSGEENSVMNAVQLLWVNLIMDTFAALALATDPADDSLLERQPEPREVPIMTVPMAKMIAAQSLYQTAITMTLHFLGPRALKSIDNDPTKTEFNTLVFNVFVWCQIFNMINCRKLDNSLNVFAGMHRNLWLLGILAIMIGGQIMIVFIGGAAFGTTPIPIAYWGVSILLGAGGLVVGFLARLLPDAPFGQILIKLGVMPNLDALPRTRTRKDTGETGDEKVHRFLSTVRSGRVKANKNFHNSASVNLKRAVQGRSDDSDVAKGLFLLPSIIAQAVTGTNRRSS